MKTEFWHQRWETNQIGFHNNEANPLLVKYFNHLSLVEGDRVFLPLCGKTRDIAWLLAKGFCVAGVELSQIAIEQLFAELGVEPEITIYGDLKHYHAKNIDIYVGDIFKLTSKVLGPINAVYDRAALVALPESMRPSYTQHLIKLVNKAPQLLLTFEYDQSLMDGPPFSINSELVHQYYQESYSLTLLANDAFPEKLKGVCDAVDNVWLLEPLK